jgi:hypothetical protein
MRFLVCGLLLAFAIGPRAQAITFDFEEHAATRTEGQIAQGVHSTLTSTRDIPTSVFSGSTTLSMTIQVVRVPFLDPNDDTPSHSGIVLDPNVRFDIRQWNLMPDEWGTRALDPTYPSGGDSDVWILATFSEPLAAITLQVTDAGIYPDTLQVLAFRGPDATSVLVDQMNATFNNASPNFGTATLELEEGFFRSVLFRAEDQIVKRGDFTDNIDVTLSEVPEPASGLLGGFTIGALAASAALLRRS